MNTDYLQDFLVLAETGNYEEAAFRLYTTQSTLSKHIQNLEEELGSPLFVKANGRSTLSDFGELFIPFARKYFFLIEDFQQKQNNETRVFSNSFKISYNQYMEAYGIFDIIKDFHERYPELVVIVNNDSPGKNLDLGQSDIAMLFEGDHDNPRFARVPVFTDHFSLVVSRKHRLARESGVVSAKNLSGEIFITCHNTSFISQLTKSFWRKYGITANVRTEMPSIGSAIKLVELSGDCSMLLPSAIAKYYISEESTVIDILEDFTLNISLMSLKGKELPAVAETFTRYATEKFEGARNGNILS